MSKRNKYKIKPQKKANLIPKPKIEQDFREHGLKFSFEDFDLTQSINLDEWEKLGHLSATLNKLFHYSKNRKYKNCFDDKFKSYGAFPDHSHFNFPNHITEDALWASMHIGGLPCLAGHLAQGTFYIVFFDPEHKFYPIKK